MFRTFTILIFLVLLLPANIYAGQFWPVQSIDTMKHSRDVAREKAKDDSYKSVIEAQVQAIANTGASHISLGTPYDQEFIPFLSTWVATARDRGLNIWFRGNWSGWENWFNYPNISRADHLKLTHEFILTNSKLFADGDIFTPCPECENGGPGDPRKTGDVKGYRQFVKDLYQTCSQAFSTINKSVACNYFSSNGDVAKLIFDRDTSSSIGAVITVDHYVRSPQVLVSDLENLAKATGAKIVLGEFGAPIPDIHGSMTPPAQAVWIGEAVDLLARSPSVVGINYWTSFGGSTRLWEDDGTPRPAVTTLTSYFSPPLVTIHLKNAVGQAVTEATATHLGRSYQSNSQGDILLPTLTGSHQVEISAFNYSSHGLLIGGTADQIDIVLQKTNENWLFKVHKLTYRIIVGILQAIK